ncbi:unnamed protein product [Paramecium sonneborni]|uniref:Uncharacterized protein n=1 Tax=Paramecium sonneborni TaxID=65129 RepID=A0A8S1RMA5_9CILI|nr:unnamed protein product [Paramecium sonneborni]
MLFYLKVLPVPPPVENDELKVSADLNQFPIKFAGANVLDEQPVGGRKTFAISLYTEAMDGGGEYIQQTVLPLGQGLKSKAWELRQSMFLKKWQDSFRSHMNCTYQEDWKKIIVD